MELRMYGFVNYQLTGIQKGIQFGHAVVEYGQAVKKSVTIPPMKSNAMEIYNEWADNYKTVVILNGGTTNYNPKKLGTMNSHLLTLQENGIDCSGFYEEDLGDQLTAIAFIVDERVFNKVKYPDFIDFINEKYPDLRIGLRYTRFNIDNFTLDNVNKEKDSDRHEAIVEWKQMIGSDSNIFLREFLRNFKLA